MSVIKSLIILNVLVWIAQLLLDVRYQLTVKGALWPIETPMFEFHQIFTSMFLHAANLSMFPHICFNMFALFMFGRVLENMWGVRKFLFFYLTCGVGASVIHLMVQHVIRGVAPTVGASGAVMGVIIAFGYLFPNIKLIIIPIPVSIKAKWVVIGYVLLDLLGGFMKITGDNIAHFSHLGGALTGFIIVLIWSKSNLKTYS